MSKKEQSNITVASPRRYSLPKSQILRGRRNFQKLFSEASLIHSPLVNLRFTTYSSPNMGFKIGFIAPKKIGTAVQRNRTKRVLREAFRLNKHSLIDTVNDMNLGVHAALIAHKADLSSQEVHQQVATLLEELRTRLLSINK